MKVLASLLLVASTASADCGDIAYEVVGAVTDNAGRPIPGATVSVKWGATGKEDEVFVASAPSGDYKLPFRFNTYSGRSSRGTDECRQQLKEVIVRASAKGHTPQELRLQVVGTLIEANLALPSAPQHDA